MNSQSVTNNLSYMLRSLQMVMFLFWTSHALASWVKIRPTNTWPLAPRQSWGFCLRVGNRKWDFTLKWHWKFSANHYITLALKQPDIWSKVYIIWHTFANPNSWVIWLIMWYIGLHGSNQIPVQGGSGSKVQAFSSDTGRALFDCHRVLGLCNYSWWTPPQLCIAYSIFVLH